MEASPHIAAAGAYALDSCQNLVLVRGLKRDSEMRGFGCSEWR